MATERRVARNTIFLLAGQIGQALCSLVLWFIIARFLTSDAIGQYSLAVSLSALFSIITKVGYEKLAIREVARHREGASAYLGDILILKGGLALAGYLMLVVAVLVVGYSRDKGALILVVGATTFMATLIMALEWCFRAFERMEYQGGMRLVQGLGKLGLGASVLLLGGGILGVALAQLVVICFFFAFLYSIVGRRFVRPAWRLDWIAFGALTRQALPFGLGTFASVLLLNADTVMLSHIKGDAVTGLYNLAYRLVDGLRLLPIAFSLALYPAMSNAFKKDRQALKGLIIKAWYLMVVVAVPAAVGTTFLADRLIVLLFGTRYEAAGPVLALLVWAGALMFLFSVISTTLAAIDQQPAAAGLVFLGTAINVFLNLFFITRWGACGASLALVVAMMVMTALGLLYISRHLAIPHWGSPLRYASMVAATAAMTVGLWSLRGANLAVVVLAGSVIYTVVIFATRGLKWADLEVLRHPASGESIHVAP
jgi:O-antigen/teichoic acid export membrane protein